MKYLTWIGILLFLWSCKPETSVAEARRPAQRETAEDVATPASLPLRAHSGWIFCGGSWTAGKGADLGEGYADQLGDRVVNAGISGEPLPGLLERLPALLKRHPGGLALEVGYEDEALQAPVAAFQRHLNELEQVLQAHPGLQLLFIISATDEIYQNPILESAARLAAPTFRSPHFAAPPSPQQHTALAQQLRERL